MPTDNPSAPSAKPIQCACTNLKMAARSVGRLYDEALVPTGLNSSQYAILANIRRQGKVPKMELARLLMMDRTTLYRAVAVLEKRQLVASRRAGSGREETLSLTPEGATLAVEAEVRWEVAQERFVRAFGGDWPQLLGLLRRAQETAGSAGFSPAGM